MMKKLLLFVIAMSLAVHSYANDNTTDNTTVDIMADVANVKTYSADFVQTNIVKDFGEDVYSGKVYIDMKKRALWDYTEPYITWYLFTNEYVEQFDEVNNQLMRYPNTEDSDSVILQVLMDFSTLSDVFDVEQEGNSTLHLMPKRDIGLRYMIIEVVAGKIVLIESEDTAGNKTRINFSNVKTNENIDGAVFVKSLPEGVEVFDVEN